MSACECYCGEPATNQALYRRRDGSHFLGSPMCDRHAYPLGRLEYAQSTEIVSHVPIVL